MPKETPVVTITIASANVCANPKRRQKNVRTRIRQAMRAAEVTFGQEITPLRYRLAWRIESARQGKTYKGLGTEVPISVPWRLWKLRAAYSSRVHGGLRKVSPSRYFTAVAGRRGGYDVALIDVHTVSKGYSGARHRATQWAWRNNRLALYWKRLDAEIERFHDKGYTVIVGGDCNWPGAPAPHPGAEVVTASGLDHLWVIPADGIRVTVSARANIPAAKRSLGMDHPILVGAVTLMKES